MKLSADFYRQPDVVRIARQLLGKVLVTSTSEGICSGIITETEAYNGIIDKASHAYGGRRTTRTEIMYATGGTAYVYLIYGIHSLFNVVTNEAEIPHAVLIRSVLPLEGIPIMEKRRKMNSGNPRFTSGPGNVSMALGIHYSQSGISLLGNQIWLEDDQVKIDDNEIISGPRIGVDYAGKDALLPYRFLIKDISMIK